MQDRLIIFYRNPELSKVKTRLAATVGDARALAIYIYLAHHTRIVAAKSGVPGVVYYSSFIEESDTWTKPEFAKALQRGEDLGERMLTAFAAEFGAGFRRVCIIGTDCIDLTAEVIGDAFKALHTRDVVLGPAADGGYCLLGMKALHPAFFSNKNWSSPSVLSATLGDCSTLGLSVKLLTELRDVDTEADLPPRLRNVNLS